MPGSSRTSASSFLWCLPANTRGELDEWLDRRARSRQGLSRLMRLSTEQRRRLVEMSGRKLRPGRRMGSAYPSLDIFCFVTWLREMEGMTEIQARTVAANKFKASEEAIKLAYYTVRKKIKEGRRGP